MTIKELTLEFKKFQQETIENFNKMLGLINENNEEQKPKKELTIWAPKDGEKYYFIDLYGRVDSCLFNAGDSFDSQMMAIGNVYQTKEDAERFALINRFTNLYRKYIEEHDEIVDWHDYCEEKWYAFYNYKENRIDISCDYDGQCQGVVYATNRQIIVDAIDFIGEKNMLQYVLEIEVDDENPLPM